jgi:hypothetical protein
MSRRAPSLAGTEHYEWGNTSNPPTSLQLTHIKFIYKHLGIRFEGNNSRQAYEFIGKHYEQAKKAKRGW